MEDRITYYIIKTLYPIITIHSFSWDNGNCLALAISDINLRQLVLVTVNHEKGIIPN